MTIKKYEGGELPPGTIVCRRSVMTCGFASRPVTVTKVSGSRAYVQDAEGKTSMVSLSTICWIVDTFEEGLKFAEASIELVCSEQKCEQEFLRARSQRRETAIALALADEKTKPAG